MLLGVLGLWGLMFVPGCYASHGTHEADASASVDAAPDAPDTATGLDAGPSCVDAGTYDVPYQLESATPAGCEGALPDTIPITFPLEETFRVDPGFSSLTLTPVGTCQWAFEYEEDYPFPGTSYRSSGVIGVGADGVFGRVESNWIADVAPGCDTVIILGLHP